MRNDITVILTLILVIIAILSSLHLFWPVVLVLLVAGCISYFKNKHDRDEAIKMAEKEEDNLQEELFKEQVKRKKKENAEIIDAEFEEKEDSNNGYNK